MANNTTTPTIKLPEDSKKRLEELDGNIAEAERGIAVLKKLGMDVKQLESQIKWAKEVRLTLLESFGK